jgi:hypothetical protein
LAENAFAWATERAGLERIGRPRSAVNHGQDHVGGFGKRRKPDLSVGTEFVR